MLPFMVEKVSKPDSRQTKRRAPRRAEDVGNDARDPQSSTRSERASLEAVGREATTEATASGGALRTDRAPDVAASPTVRRAVDFAEPTREPRPDLRASGQAVEMDGAVLERFAHAESIDDVIEFMKASIDIVRQWIGARAAIAALDADEVQGAATETMIAVHVDPSLAGTFLREAGERCTSSSETPSPHALADEHGVEGTLLSGLLEASGFRSCVCYPLRRGNDDFGSVRFLFGPADRPPPRVLIAARYLIGRMMLTVDHIRTRRRADAANAKLQAVVDGAFDAMLLIDDHVAICAANPAAHRMFVFARGALVGQSVSRILPGFARAISADVLRRPDGFLREMEGLRRDGERFAVECSVSRVAGGSARVLVIRDVSERRIADNRLREADRLAMIGTLAAGLGHDMNNVLLPIRAHVNALEHRAERSDAVRRRAHISELRGGISYLQHLADSLHYLAMDPDAEADGSASTDIEGWWRQTGPLLSKSLHRAATLEVAIEAGLPPIPAPPHALTRAVLNLLVNAREAMPITRERNDCRVWLIARRGEGAGVGSRDGSGGGCGEIGQEVLLEVRDNGVGMTPEVRRRALELFFTTKTRGLGTGLGLPLIRNVMERAGGSVEIDSIPHEGTTIRLRFPALLFGGREVPADADADACAASDASADTRMKALVQGLDARTCAVVETILAGRGLVAVHELHHADCALCVVGSGTIDARVLAHWLRERPVGQIVVIGDPKAAFGGARLPEDANIVPDACDLGEIERAIDRALGWNRREERDATQANGVYTGAASKDARA